MLRYPALFVFVLAFIIRISYSVFIQQIQPESIYQYDSWGYLSLAKNLFDNQVFSQILSEPQTPDSTRMPIYPVFIALFHLAKLGGEWIIYIQALFGALTAFFTFKIAEIINRKNAANILAGLLVAVDLPSIFMGNLVATENLFTLLLVAAIYYAVKGVRFKEESAFTVSIIILALATLVRPITLYYSLFIPISYFLFSGFGFFRRIRTLVIHLVILAIFIGSWVYRNNSTFGTPFFSSISEVNLLFHTSTQTRSIAENRPQKLIELEYRNDSLGYLDFVNDAGAMGPFISFAQTETQRVVKKHPIVFLKMWATSCVMFFIKPMRSYFNMQLKGDNSYSAISSVEERRKGDLLAKTLDNSDTLTLILVTFQILMLGLIYLGILFSLRHWLTKDLTIFLLLFSLVGYFALVSSLTEVDSRFRVPAIPILAILCVPVFSPLFNRIAGHAN